MINVGDMVYIEREDRDWEESKNLVGMVGFVAYDGCGYYTIDFVNRKYDFMHGGGGHCSNRSAYNLDKKCVKKVR